MNEEERDGIEDLLPKGGAIWGWEDELHQFSHATLDWWLGVLGHSSSSETHRCCEKCGCATTCTAAAFYEATVTTVVRELDKLGLLKKPGEEM
jgi:hypothetical protein